jgi:hypothetical protein
VLNVEPAMNGGGSHCPGSDLEELIFIINIIIVGGGGLLFMFEMVLSAALRFAARSAVSGRSALETSSLSPPLPFVRGWMWSRVSLPTRILVWVVRVPAVLVTFCGRPMLSK